MKQIIRTVIRDCGAQVRIASNLNETRWQKAQRTMWVLVYLTKAFVIAVKAMRREALGERVIYQNRTCVVSNWAGSDAPTLSAESFYRQRCDRSEIRAIPGLHKYTNRFVVGFDWYMGSWLKIDVQRRMMGG